MQNGIFVVVAFNAFIPELMINSRSTIATFRFNINIFNFANKLISFRSFLIIEAFNEFIIARATDTKNFTHKFYWVFILMFLNKSILHYWLFAKYAAAFLNVSISIFKSLFSFSS